MQNTSAIYKAGDIVEVTTNSANEITAWHSIPIGAICKILRVCKNGYCVIEVVGNEKLRDLLNEQDFRMADHSENVKAYTMQEYKERLARCPTDSEGKE